MAEYQVHQLKNVFLAKLILTVIYQVKGDANNVDQHLKHSEEQLLVNVLEPIETL